MDPDYPRRSWFRIGLPVLLVLACAAVAVFVLFGPGSNNRTVFALSDWHFCIYDKEDGTLTELPPGSGSIEVENDAIVFGTPVSQRFLNSSNTTKRDPGIPRSIVGQDLSFRTTHMEAESLFYFNLSKSCVFVDRHMKRNIPQHILNDKDLVDKFGFNVRTRQDALAYLGIEDPGEQQASTESLIAQIPWFKWLNENMFKVMQEVGEPLLRTYEWGYYQFNLPVNADREGILPCEEFKQDPNPAFISAEETPNVPETIETCVKHVPSEGIARDLLEDDYEEAFSPALTAKIDGQFFCGNLYDKADPENCTPVTMDILRIYVDPQYQALIDERLQQMSLREQAVNDLLSADLIRNATTAQLAEQKALDDQAATLNEQQLAQEALLDEQRLTNEETLHQQQVDHESALAAQVANAGGVDPAVAEAERQAALERIADATAAAKQVAICTAAGLIGPENGQACVDLILANKGITQPPTQVFSGLPSPAVAAAPNN